MKPTTLRIPQYLTDKIEETANKRGIKSSVLIREILIEWFREKKFKKEVIDTYYDWQEILHSAEFKAGFRDAFLDLLPEIEKAQTRIVVGVFHSPEYQHALTEMIHDVLTSSEYQASQIEVVSEILLSSQLIEHLAEASTRIDRS